MSKIWNSVKFKLLGGSIRALNIVNAKYENTECSKEEVQMYYCVVKDYLKQCKQNKIDLTTVDYIAVDKYMEEKSKEIIENEKA